MVVLKFGGTSIADAQPILRVASIVARQSGSRIVVVSALAGVTDRLVQAANQARDGKAEMACGVLDGLVRRHEAVAKALSLRPDRRSGLLDSLNDTRTDAASLVAKAAADRRLEGWILDAILAAGELMSSRLVAEALSARDIPATWIDPRKVIATDDVHGCAAVDIERTSNSLAHLVAPVLADGRVPVTGGFVGASVGGRTTTLGRGGSDVTAAAVGVGLGASEIQIWTDVDGVLAADPRVVAHACCVPHLSFGEARDLALGGAKVLHPGTLDVAALRNLPVRVLNSRRPDNTTGTLVGVSREPQPLPVALACRRQACVVAMKPRAGTAAALLDDALGLVQRLSPRPILAVTTKDDRVIAAFDDALAAADFGAGVKDIADVRMERDVAVLAAVAEGLAQSPRAHADIVAALDGLTIHALARTPSGLSVIAILDDVDLPEAMTRLHDRHVAASGADLTGNTADPARAGLPDDTALAGASS